MPEGLAVVAFDGTAAPVREAIDLLNFACGEDSDGLWEFGQIMGFLRPTGFKLSISEVPLRRV